MNTVLSSEFNKVINENNKTYSFSLKSLKTWMPCSRAVLRPHRYIPIMCKELSILKCKYIIRQYYLYNECKIILIDELYRNF